MTFAIMVDRHVRLFCIPNALDYFLSSKIDYELPTVTLVA